MVSHSTILLAEPDEALSASLRFTLELQGYRIVTVAPECLDEADLGRSAVACLILGERPRGTDGLAAAIRIRCQHCSLPIVVLTTNPSRATIADARNNGVILVEKPLLGETLADTLRMIVAARDAA